VVHDDAPATQQAAIEMAETIAANSPLAVQGAKAVMRAGRNRSVEEALDYVALWNAAFLHSNDLGEALLAFSEKRPPRFEGR
jgi:enoyl-CoA hydratase